MAYDGPFSLDGLEVEPFEVDDLRADIAELEDQVLGLEHDLDEVAKILRRLTPWFDTLGTMYLQDELDVTEDEQAVLERLLHE